MDSFEWNKIAGWVLTAGIAVLGLSIVTGEVYHAGRPEKMGYVVEGVEVEAEAGGSVAAEKPIAFYLATASAEKGEGVYKKCASCHTITPGGANGIGPNLHAVVGRKIAGHPGFGYSDALKSKAGGWGFEELSQWLKSPKAYAPGNKMSFAGISKPEDRANLIAYLNAQGSNLPLPAVTAEIQAAPDSATEAPVAGTEGDKEASATAKAPDVPEASPVAATGAQPQNNRGGPGAADVTGTAERDVQQ